MRDDDSMKVFTIVGTRPEIIKMSPIIRLCIQRNINNIIIHSGQHYSPNMDKIFFEELKLPLPHANLNVGSGLPGAQTARIIEALESIILKEKPDVILAQGDTNTVLGAAIAATKTDVNFAHVEAGLRSFDRNMPEENNRIIADHISTYLYAPTIHAVNNLFNEGISNSKVFLTGNTIVDAVQQNTIIAKDVETPFIIKKPYFLITIHRAENVDNLLRLESILSGLMLLSKTYPYELILPLHPRTKKVIEGQSINTGNIRVVEPVGYIEFLKLIMDASLILTDSGGIQEESCILGVPCVTLRENTERPETIEVGANILAGYEPEKIVKSVKIMLNKEMKWENPFGDGKASERIIEHLVHSYSYHKIGKFTISPEISKFH